MQMNKMALIIFLTRRPLVGGFFLLLLVMAGCAENDRYEFVTGPGPGEMGSRPGGQLTSFRVPELDRLEDPRVLVLSPDDLLVASSQFLHRVRGDHCSVRESPGGEVVTGFAVDAAGGIHCIESRGVVSTLVDDTWTRVAELAGADFRGILRDGQDRLVAYGSVGMVWRENAKTYLGENKETMAEIEGKIRQICGLARVDMAEAKK